jgi:hypothetical protein
MLPLPNVSTYGKITSGTTYHQQGNSMSEQPQNPSFSHNQPVSNVWKRILFVALTVFFISLLYQTFLFASDNKYQIQAFGEVRDGSQDPPLDLQLHISYPAQVRLEEPGKRGRPILVWLQPKRPITSSDIALPITYTVHFEPAGEGLVFTDNDGIPIAPQAEIELGNRLGGPGVVYLHRAPLVEDISDTVIIEAIVDYPSRPGVPMQNSLRLPVKLEGRLVAGLRRFAELLLGPGTFLLALATALVSFGLQRWVQQDKERREREQSIQANMAKLKSLRPLVVEDISRAVCQWWEYRQKAKTDVDWTEPMLDVELDDIWRSIESQP